MVDPLTFVLGKISLATRTPADGFLTLGDRVQESSTDSDLGRIYCKVREKMEKQEVLSWRNTTNIEESKLPAQSQAVEALLNLFGEETDGATVYVLYDKPGTGKSSAGMAVLKHFNTFPTTGEKIKGLMFSTDRTDELYVESMAKFLEASKVEGWLNALLLAMDRPFEERRSLLILDDFNSLGPDRKNIDFINQLYDIMNPMVNKMNIVVVVMTRNEEVANELCGCYGGVRVQPINGFYTGTDKIKPAWKNSYWSRKLLIDALKYEFHSRIEDKSEDDEFFSFVEDGMTPMTASKAAEKALKAAAKKNEKPSSPQKRKMEQHNPDSLSLRRSSQNLQNNQF